MLKSNSIFRACKRYSTLRRAVILGIETSCDDTGCAIVDSDGNILGESLHSQHLLHLNHGGIIPPIAQDLHRKHIEGVVDEAVVKSGLNFDQIDAVAVTVKPGLPLSLLVGMKYGKHLCRLHHKPFIPIHHMQAHALTARMHNKALQFPFLLLLISGGHCLLAIAKSVDEFLLLGEGVDDAPGEAFDKMARRSKLRNLPTYAQLSGGQAIELAASHADNPIAFNFSIPMLQYKDCNFSLAGVKAQFLRFLLAEEAKYGTPPDGVIPTINNLCASFQLVITRHLCHRLQRGMEYAEMNDLLPKAHKTLVVAGGCACNNFIATGLQIVCEAMDYALVRPPPHLCTDNGVMIAWNGIERWHESIGIVDDLNSIDIEKSSLIGRSLIDDVIRASLRSTWVRLSRLNVAQSQWSADMLQRCVRQ